MVHIHLLSQVLDSSMSLVTQGVRVILTIVKFDIPDVELPKL
jgi:hypothetical protein